MSSYIMNAEDGPLYPSLGAKVAKFRKLKKLTIEQRREYAQVIEETIRELQRQELQRELPSFRPHCASGTWHTTGQEIHDAIRQQQRNALLRCPDKIRRARTDVEWTNLYEEAMIEKKRRQEERKSKTKIVADLLMRSYGCSTAEALMATGWSKIGFPGIAKRAGLKLRRSDDGRYFGAAAHAVAPSEPTETARDRRQFRVIEEALA